MAHRWDLGTLELSQEKLMSAVGINIAQLSNCHKECKVIDILFTMPIIFLGILDVCSLYLGRTRIIILQKVAKSRNSFYGILSSIDLGNIVFIGENKSNIYGIHGLLKCNIARLNTLTWKVNNKEESRLLL